MNSQKCGNEGVNCECVCARAHTHMCEAVCVWGKLNKLMKGGFFPLPYLTRIFKTFF